MQKIHKTEVSIGEIGVKAGLVISVSLAFYFMIMKWFNFMGHEIAWAGNFIILFVGMIWTYRYYRFKTKPIIDYIPGLILGCLVTVASVVPFSIFVYGYFLRINPLLLAALQGNSFFMGEQISPERAAASNMVAGISSGFVMAFIIMQYYKAGFRRVKSTSDTLG